MSTERAADQVAERLTALDELLRQRDGLLTVMDRVVALQGTARLIRVSAGADSGFVADLEAPDQAVVRWMSGTRTNQLQNLVVPVGQGIGGRVLALGTAVRVDDYISSASITHHFDAQVRNEGIGGMLAVPIIGADGRTIALAYAAMRTAGSFGDTAVGKMQEIADQASTALRIADVAEAGKVDAIAAERLRVQSALHDSVGALLFMIGVQVRDLHQSVQDNPTLVDRLRRLESDVSAASAALRESLLVMADTTPERALPVEIAEYTRSFEARTGVPARFVQLATVAPLDAERTALLVAVVREGLLNVEKHADPQSVIVSLGAADDGGIHVVVADDSTAEVESSPSSGLGVRSLAERAIRLGGDVSLVRDEDGGCTLRCWLPR
ncbi:GAF domain-containing protein [Streptomyces sp. SID13031]|uniref:GAF domain-containing protein n=1 Tax=Streptomyces sp. SID13031 TaxID=2706046 RepID=UPI001943FCF1